MRIKTGAIMNDAINLKGVRSEVLDFAMMLNRAVCLLYKGKLYQPHWSKEFAFDQAMEIFTHIEEMQLNLPDIKTLSRSELLMLGFGRWGENGLLFQDIY